MFRQLVAGIVILLLAGGVAYYYWPREEPVCEICLRPMHEKTATFVTLDGDREVRLCCPRCALRFQEGRSDVRKSEVTGYVTGRRIAASEAIYVVGSSLHPCCSEEEMLQDRSGIEYERTWDRCLPSVIAFHSQSDAEAFQREHGGEIQTLAQIRREEVGGE